MSRRGVGAPSPLAGLLQKCREESGYPTARAFYDAAGGRPVLGCGYATYLRLERSARIPKAGTFERLHTALDCVCRRDSLRSLCRAYARALLGPDLSRSDDDRHPAHAERLPRLIAGPAWRSVLRDPAGLAALAALERGRVIPEDLPFELRQARKALDRLVRLGLARRAHGAYEPSARAFTAARSDNASDMRLDELSRQIDFLARASGDPPRGATEVVRARQSDVQALFEYLWAEAQVCANLSRGPAAPQSEVYMLDVSVRDIGCARTPRF